MQNMEVVLASIHPAGTGSADELPMHSYFRDPEVMRKIRSQEIIETPSWREATKEDWEGALLEIPEPWVRVLLPYSDCCPSLICAPFFPWVLPTAWYSSRYVP